MQAKCVCEGGQLREKISCVGMSCSLSVEPGADPRPPFEDRDCFSVASLLRLFQEHTPQKRANSICLMLYDVIKSATYTARDTVKAGKLGARKGRTGVVPGWRAGLLCGANLGYAFLPYFVKKHKLFTSYRSHMASRFGFGCSALLPPKK